MPVQPCSLPSPCRHGLSQPAHRLPAQRAVAAAALAALLSACGGGGSSDEPPAPTTTTVAVKVIDGPIVGARVCFDVNANGACDASENPQTTTAGGAATLTQAEADIGRYPLLAEVPAGAVDEVFGAVATAYTLQAPGATVASAVVSPLTTMVVAQMAAANQTAADATAAVRETMGLATSPLADYSSDASAAGLRSANAARVLALVVQSQLAATATVEGVSPAQQRDAVLSSLHAALPDVAQAVAALPSGSLASTEALASATQTVVAATGLTAATLPTLVAVRSAEPETDAPATAGASLRWFSFTDAQNYTLRMFEATAEQATTDANGMRHFTEYRERSVGSGGNVTDYQQWGSGIDNWPRDRLYWNGNAWIDCAPGVAHASTPWTSSGESSSNYCGAFRSHNRRGAIDIAGRTLDSVVRQIRGFAGPDTEGNYASWGPDPAVHAAALTAIFPAGAKLHTYSVVDTLAPEQILTSRADAVVVYDAALRAANATECNRITGANGRQFYERATTLDQLVSAMTGTPCVFTPNASTGSRNEWWNQSTQAVATLSADTTGAGSAYRSGQKALRVSFGSGNVAHYWLCLVRASDGSARNCDAAGDGTYSITNQGDARVLRLAGLPALAQQMTFERLYAERGGHVWFGVRSKPATTQQLRPNHVAAQALFTALGMPARREAVPVTQANLLQYYANRSGTGTVMRSALARMQGSSSEPFVGAFAIANEAADPLGITFVNLEDGSTLVADPMGDKACGAPGLERLTWSRASGAIRFTTVSDTNGCGGLHDSSTGGTYAGSLSFSNNNNTLTGVDDGGTTVLTRIAP